MNRINIALLCMSLLLTARLCAQQTPLAFLQQKSPKPLLFFSLPEKFECPSLNIQQLLSSPINETFILQLSDQFLIKGKIIEKIQEIPGAISINIRAENLNNALFTITVRLLADNSISVQGRLLHPKYGDALVLTKENNKFYLQKRDQRLYMPE